MASPIGLRAVSGFPRAHEPGFDCANHVAQPWVKGGGAAESELSGGRFTTGLMPEFHCPRFTRGERHLEIRFGHPVACQALREEGHSVRICARTTFSVN